MNLPVPDSSDEVVTENLHISFQDKDKCPHHHHCHLSSTASRNKTNLITQVHDVVNVLFWNLCSHGDLGSQFDLGFNFLGQSLWQVGCSYICAVT